MLAAAAPVAHAQTAGCQFVLGFQSLHDVAAGDVGDCSENQAFTANGDAQQRTTKGLMAWRKADNWTAFTNGYKTWINGPDGLVSRLNAERFPFEHDAGILAGVWVCERAIAREANPPALMTCRQAIEFATINGAIVTHLQSKVGSITPGKEADIVMLATDRFNTFPLNNVPGSVVTLMDTSNVENVFIAGKLMKWQGKLVGVDISRVKALAEKSRDGLMARSKFPSDLFGSCCVAT